jgi:purine-binding chemotaxis protein CheW
VTLRVAGRVVALAVNGVVGVRDLPPATVGDLPPLLRDAGTEVIAAVGRLDAELLFVLRSARLLSFGLGAPSPASPPSGEEPA